MAPRKPPSPPPPDHTDHRLSQVGGLVHLIQSLTLLHVLIIALLVVIAVPTYVLWRAVNDESMLNKILSRYEEYNSDKIPCTLRVASVRGGGDQFSISTGFAFQGNDRWNIGVIMDRRPSEDELISYCETLQLIVDYMRRPSAKSPTYPNSDEPLIWQYPQDEQP